MNKTTITRVGIVLGILAAILVVTQLLKGGPEVETEPPVRPVKTMAIQEVPATARRVFPGRIQASQQVNLSFIAGGDIVAFPAQEGQFLQRGELIAELDSQDARSALNAARADLDFANSELNRNQTLFDEELISAAEFDVARRSFDVALAAFEQTEKAVRDRQILAPFDGVVARRFVENFEKVQAGQSIVTFIDPEGLDITIDIPETVVMQLPHFNTELSASFEQSPDVEYPLELKEFASVADAYTKTYPVTLSMDRPEGFLVLPDMTVTVFLDATRKETIVNDTFLVPTTAIVYDVESDGSVIWVVEESGDILTVSPRTVEANRTQGGEAVVQSGIDVGDVIVIAGGGFLNRGQQVRIFEQ